MGIYDPAQNFSAIYVDGLLINSDTAATSSLSFTGYKSYIANNKYLSNQFNGDLDEIRIYNYPLSESEIVAMFEDAIPLFVYAGSDELAPLNSLFSLNGIVSGEYDAILWSQISGPGTADFSDDSVVNPDVQFDLSGIYELELSVTVGCVELCDTVIISASDKHLLAHWDFDNAAVTADVPDVTGNGYNTVCSGSSVNTVAGFMYGSTAAVRTREPSVYWQIGESASLHPDIRDLANGVTITLWFRLPDSGVSADFTRALSIEDGKLDLSFMTDGRIRFIKPTGTIYSTPNYYNDDRWHLFTGVYDPLNNYSGMYVDGQLINTSDALYSEFSFTGYKSYIANNKYLSNQFNGDIDDIKIYNYAFSDSEVESLYASDNPFQIDAGPRDFTCLGSYNLNAEIVGTWTSVLWSQISGPDSAVFSDTQIEDPVVTFAAPGIYELQITAVQYDRVMDDTVKIYVYSSLTPQLISHWNFDGLASSPDMLDMTGNGYDAVCSIANPVAVSGYIWGSSGAANLYSTPAQWSILESESQDLTYGYTLSAWLKVPADESDEIIYFCPTDVELVTSQAERARWISSDSIVYGTTLVNDDKWHHVVAIYDPINNSNALYLDGVLDAETDVFQGEFGFDGSEALIGGKSGLGDFDGCLDDIRLYRNAMTAGEVELLFADTVPIYVDAGADIDLASIAENAVLHASIIHHALPVTISWSVVEAPGSQAIVTFSNPHAADTTASFSEAGTYLLNIEVDNGSLTVCDNISVNITEWTCQDVIDAGLIMSADLNSDCYVDINDLALMASAWLSQNDMDDFAGLSEYWLDCNNPADPACFWPF